MSRTCSTMTANSHMFKFIDTRMNYLKCLLHEETGAKGSARHTKASKEASDAIITQLARGTPLPPEEAVGLLESIRNQDPFTETDRLRLLESIGSRVDMEGKSCTAPTDMVSHFNPHPEKQTCDVIENYITEKILADMGAG